MNIIEAAYEGMRLAVKAVNEKTAEDLFEQDNILLEANGGTHNCNICTFNGGECPEFCPNMKI